MILGDSKEKPEQTTGTNPVMRAGNTFEGLRCERMQWTGNMLLVRFDTEKQLRWALETSSFCAPSGTAWTAAEPTP